MKPLLLALALVLATISVSFAGPLPPAPEDDQSCANVLNLLPRIVRKEAVAAIPADRHVVIHGICGGILLEDFGNAVGLSHAIEANTALNNALVMAGWTADDVIGIDLTGRSVHLYVHRN